MKTNKLILDNRSSILMSSELKDIVDETMFESNDKVQEIIKCSITIDDVEHIGELMKYELTDSSCVISLKTKVKFLHSNFINSQVSDLKIEFQEFDLEIVKNNVFMNQNNLGLVSVRKVKFDGLAESKDGCFVTLEIL